MLWLVSKRSSRLSASLIFGAIYNFKPLFKHKLKLFSTKFHQIKLLKIIHRCIFNQQQPFCWAGLWLTGLFKVMFVCGAGVPDSVPAPVFFSYFFPSSFFFVLTLTKSSITRPKKSSTFPPVFADTYTYKSACFYEIYCAIFLISGVISCSRSLLFPTM